MSSQSLLEQCGIGKEEIQNRLEQTWYEIFEGPHKFYFTTQDGLGYVVDTGNNDVRTEGMSYAMMLAVQYDRQDIFDALWGWVLRYMYMDSGTHAHYFAWSAGTDGIPNAQGPAPDGEEFFAASLLLAHRRWQTSPQGYEYKNSALQLLRYCVHKGEDGASQNYEGYAMWNPDNALIRFVPEVEWSDPSYHLPHFYELFAQECDPSEQEFWQRAAQASRAYLASACNPDTGLNPEYADYDGSPHIDERNHWFFFSDAYRTGANIGLDAVWTHPTDALVERVVALQDFLLTHDRTCVYQVDGTAVDERVLHPVALIATTAQAGLAAQFADKQQYPQAWSNLQAWVRLFWYTPLRVGSRRYYDNLLAAFALLALSGNYRNRW